MIPRPRILLVLALLTLVSLAGPARAQNYPRIALYGSINGQGSPYIRNDGSLDTTAIGMVARFPLVSLDVNPVTPYHPEILTALRARNPNIRLLAYVLAEDIWPVVDRDSLRHIPSVIYRAVRDRNGFLYDKITGKPYYENRINLAKRDATGRLVVVEAMADIFRDHIMATGSWDGLFCDLFCRNIAWTQQGSGWTLDYARAGYPSVEALEASWGEAFDSLTVRLRRDWGPNAILVGNCAQSAGYEHFNGWMREDFPYQLGGSWYTNMLDDPYGVFADDRAFQSPPHNWLFSQFGGPHGTQYTVDDMRRVRFGLASGALSEAFHAWATGDKFVATAPYHEYWYDEYAVDVRTGRSSEALEHTGWLGQALGPAYQMIWIGSNPDVVTNPSFETSVTSGWQFSAFGGATGSVVRDTNTAAVGRSSARIRTATPGAVDWYISYTTAGNLPVQAWLSYATTFWCKASSPRVIKLVAYVNADNNATSLVAVDTTWRQYQVIMKPPVAGNARLTFWLGTQAGDVWVDDVHMQEGPTTIYRRDFQNGIVLVNPSSLPLQVSLGTPYRRLLGLKDLAINDGSAMSSVTVPIFDGLFLLNAEVDNNPPRPITDLHLKR